MPGDLKESATRLQRFCSGLFLALVLFGLALPTSSNAHGNSSPPLELPVYDQPPMPPLGLHLDSGLLGGGPLDYYWVPGTWVEPPSARLLWTPGYWGWHDGIYSWNAGYWGHAHRILRRRQLRLRLRLRRRWLPGSTVRSLQSDRHNFAAFM
jgi:hypothetical protein